MNIKSKLFAISFIEGALVMVVEIASSKLLAPFFGTSLYVWSAILSITLGGLAMGYFIGGLLSKKTNVLQLLFINLIAASCMIALMPFLKHLITPIALHLSLIPAVIVSSGIIILPSIILLSTTSPLLIFLLSKTNLENSGLNSGKIYATSTVGGIIATFMSGFYFIPTFGISHTLIGFASLLVFASFLILKDIKPKLKTGALLIVMCFLALSFTSLKNNKSSLFYQEGILGIIEVKDQVQSDKSIIRKLLINNIVQTEMDLQTKKSVADYSKIIDSLIGNKYHHNALILGLGGGLIANSILKNSHSVTGVEFDERMIYAAKNYFYLNENVKTSSADARFYLNNCNEVFDLVVFDLFKAEEQPSYILTIESLTKLKSNLTDSATIIINTHGYLDSEIGQGTQCLLATLTQCGFYITVFATNPNPNYRNLIIVAKQTVFSYSLKSKIPFKITNSTLVNTDDKPILENLNAQANQTWRMNYLQNYILQNN